MSRLQHYPNNRPASAKKTRDLLPGEEQFFSTGKGREIRYEHRAENGKLFIYVGLLEHARQEFQAWETRQRMREAKAGATP